MFPLFVSYFLACGGVLPTDYLLEMMADVARGRYLFALEACDCAGRKKQSPRVKPGRRVVVVVAWQMPHLTLGVPCSKFICIRNFDICH